MKDKKLGHRQRLRERFLKSGIEAFLDYEIVEILLTFGTPRRDCKPQAKELIEKFKSLKGVLEAKPEELQQVKGVGPNNIFGIKFFQALLTRYYKEKISEKPILNSVPLVVKFLQQKLSEEKREIFLILILDSRFKLIKTSEISTGTVNSTLVHPREIFKEPILASASFIILAHNHPSGNPTPSKEDVQITKRIIESGKILGIKVIDHIIVSRDYYYSFKEKGLIDRLTF